MASDRKDGGSEPAERKYMFQQLFSETPENIAMHTPHCAYLGMEVLELAPNKAVLKLPHRPELVGDPERGVVFGGVITTLVDHASGMSVFCSLEEFRAIATIDLRIDYLRAARPGADLIGEAICYKLTRNVAFVRSTAFEEDPSDPFATGLGTFMVGAHNAGGNMARYMDTKKEESK